MPGFPALPEQVPVSQTLSTTDEMVVDQDYEFDFGLIETLKFSVKNNTCMFRIGI